jgi:hypothetical protein
MPYLHWETDRRRSRVDEIIRNLTEEHKEKEYKEDKRLARERSKAAVSKASNTNGTAPLGPPPEAKKGGFWSVAKSEKDRPTCDERHPKNESVPRSFKLISTLTEVVEAKVKESKKSRPLATKKAEKNKGSRMIMPCTVLGQVLFRAAVLSEAMEYHFDRELLRDHLHKTPPLHPRRTLDQSYYWTLKTTKKRDRDQVVYRGTAPQKEFMHHHNCKKKKEHCDHHHCNWTPEKQCDQCQDDIRRVARVVMVDQLWLWILDASKYYQLFVLQA